MSASWARAIDGDRLLQRSKLAPHELYLFMSAQENTYVDVSETIDIKARGLLCHVSQFGTADKMLERVRHWAAETARAAKEKKGLEMDFAKSFRRIKLYIPAKPASDAEQKEAEIEA